MGCVSSSLLHQDDDFPQIGSTAFSHHFVSLTSTTYGLLTLDPPPPSPMTPPVPPPRFTVDPTITTTTTPPEVINSWELMDGLDFTDSFRFSPFCYSHSHSTPSTPTLFSKSKPKPKPVDDIENVDPNRLLKPLPEPLPLLLEPAKYSLDGFPELCPPNGEDKVVLYTTTLRGVRSTFDACNCVRSTLQALGVSFSERDISMDRGFRDELHRLLSPCSSHLPPRLFVKGRYLGGADQVVRIHEDGGLVQLLAGLPRIKSGSVCDGCGDVRFLPCFRCSGSCKLVATEKPPHTVVTRCPDCNENGLVLCPICS